MSSLAAELLARRRWLVVDFKFKSKPDLIRLIELTSVTDEERLVLAPVVLKLLSNLDKSFESSEALLSSSSTFFIFSVGELSFPSSFAFFFSFLPLSLPFDFCITDVAQANARSLKAHKNTGYQVIDTLSYGGIAWDIVLWDWRK